MGSQYVLVKMVTLLDGKLCVKTFGMLYVDCSNGRVVSITNKNKKINQICIIII